MRGQVNQAFLFIMAAIIIVATIFLSLRLIGSLGDAACKASDAAFMQAVDELVDASRVYGSRDSKARLRVPCDAQALCFVDARAVGTTAFSSDDATITTAVRSGSRTNLFLRTQDGTIDAGYDERIILALPEEDAPMRELCVDAKRGAFSFTTEGYGRYVRIAP